MLVNTLVFSRPADLPVMAMGWAADCWEEYMVKRGVMLRLMPIPHVFQMNEIFPTSRTTDNSGSCVLNCGPDVCHPKLGVTTLVMSEIYTKTKSSGVQYQTECCHAQADSSQA